ncbi:hypothetical protein L1987_34221 [Smallanthus sonchifolius]|uniref:Uncharacterized protein n=1 Tax=Smallanthus sonchifolius TaxID=185202 RepID=A0ACB9HTY6_9ASTR|nr:hypothetical protein L1987_34221 [Smallanthus sonchifolius]
MRVKLSQTITDIVRGPVLKIPDYQTKTKIKFPFSLTREEITSEGFERSRIRRNRSREKTKGTTTRSLERRTTGIAELKTGDINYERKR